MSEDSWNDWKEGFDLPSSWPSGKPDIDVDRNMLKKIGQAMKADLENSRLEQYDEWKEPREGFGSSIYYPQWRTLVSFQVTVFRMAKALKKKTTQAREDYSSIASMVVASSINYDRAEGIFEANQPRLEKAINGARHEFHETLRPEDEPEGVSKYDAPTIKRFFDELNLDQIARQQELFHQLATEMTELQDVCQQRAHDLSISWKSSATEHALEAMRKICATSRTLAYTAGATGDAVATLSQNLKGYKTNFESIVNMDQTFGEWLNDRLWDMDEDDRARNLLLDANVRVVNAHHLLPLKLETRLPNVVPISSTLTKIESGDERFWARWEQLMQRPR